MKLLICVTSLATAVDTTEQEILTALLGGATVSDLPAPQGLLEYYGDCKTDQGRTAIAARLAAHFAKIQQ